MSDVQNNGVGGGWTAGVPVACRQAARHRAARDERSYLILARAAERVRRLQHALVKGEQVDDALDRAVTAYRRARAAAVPGGTGSNLTQGATALFAEWLAQASFQSQSQARAS